ncbi:AAA family ATPase [Arthrobacter methylotrophus]|uniref:AAA family ATPase n=1 Tax=Arthrobacter methylotrophus TaxID=121291 RepID=A0ABV5UU80_9MICC
MTISPREIERQLPRTCQKISFAVEYAREGNIDVLEHRDSRASGLTELLIIAEADWLKPPALEQVRDYYDRHTMGVILIGMPGIEKRFAHHYRTLSTEELTFVLTNRWQELGLSIDPQDFTDAEAIAAVARITNRNFRLIQRLFTQIARIRDINELNSITKEASKQPAKPCANAATAPYNAAKYTPNTAENYSHRRNTSPETPSEILLPTPRPAHAIMAAAVNGKGSDLRKHQLRKN